jgi:CheY-like chemotaxis protein
MQYSMEQTLLWLRNVEQLASDVYMAVALDLKEDREFSSFLLQMKEDEAWHFHLIGSAAHYFSERNETPRLDITVDSTMTKVLEVPFQNLLNKIADHSVTRQDVVDFIVEVEFAELNHIFLYVLDLAKSCQAFEYVAASMQAHENRIQKFLESLPGNIKIPDDFYKRPQIWKEKILIVEDDMAVRELFARVLGDLGAVETANNGQEALDKVKDHFFNVVVSDIGMPVMNGVEFYGKAIETDPQIGSRFLFCSGDFTPDIEKLCTQKNLECLEKPVKLQALKQAVKEIMDKSL